MIKLIRRFKKGHKQEQTTIKVDKLTQAEERKIFDMLTSALITWAKAEEYRRARRNR